MYKTDGMLEATENALRTDKDKFSEMRKQLFDALDEATAEMAYVTQFVNRAYGKCLDRIIPREKLDAERGGAWMDGIHIFPKMGKLFTLAEISPSMNKHFFGELNERPDLTKQWWDENKAFFNKLHPGIEEDLRQRHNDMVEAKIVERTEQFKTGELDGTLESTFFGFSI